MMARLICSGLFFVLLPFMPWWMMLAAVAALIFFFGAYETMLGGIAFDFLYSVPVAWFFGFEFFYTVACLCIGGALYVLKERLLLS